MNVIYNPNIAGIYELLPIVLPFFKGTSVEYTTGISKASLKSSDFSIYFAKIAILFQKTIYVLRFLCNFP